MFTARDVARVLFGWEPEDKDKLADTAWLNGVRGLAAFLVMMSHFTMDWASPWADAPFGAMVTGDRNVDGIWYYQDGERFWAPWRLPILRVFMCAGGGQVAVFFVISGFVLTYGPLGLVKGGEYSKLYNSLGSSTFRRWFRLYIPCMVVTFSYLIRRNIVEGAEFLTWLKSFWEYFLFAEKWANPFKSVHEVELTEIYGYNVVMWTIPWEFSGSIFVYVLLLFMGRVQSFARRVTVVILISIYALFSYQWGLWLFGSGMALADYVRHAGGSKKLSQSIGKWSTITWSSCLALGFLQLSFMPQSPWFTRPGYEWTEYLPLPYGFRDAIGEERFWWGCGGILIIASTAHLSFARKFYETAFLQHLGKISFMLYLIHFLVVHTVSSPLKQLFYDSWATKEFDSVWNGEVYRTTPFMNIGIYVILWFICVPLSMIVAHFLERTVDRPLTALAKWMDVKLVKGFDFGKKDKLPITEEVLQQAEEEEELLKSRTVEDERDSAEEGDEQHRLQHDQTAEELELGDIPGRRH